jgi:hypothetical protein
MSSGPSPPRSTSSPHVQHSPSRDSSASIHPSPSRVPRPLTTQVSRGKLSPSTSAAQVNAFPLAAYVPVKRRSIRDNRQTAGHCLLHSGCSPPPPEPTPVYYFDPENPDLSAPPREEVAPQEPSRRPSNLVPEQDSGATDQSELPR